MRCYELYEGNLHRFEDKAVISAKITVKEICFDGLSFLCFGYITLFVIQVLPTIGIVLSLSVFGT